MQKYLCDIKTNDTFNFLDFIKKFDISLLLNTKSSNTTRLILSLDIVSKLISFIKICTSFSKLFFNQLYYHLNWLYKYAFFHKYYFELLN